jgi:hypothetical protein
MLKFDESGNLLRVDGTRANDGDTWFDGTLWTSDRAVSAFEEYLDRNDHAEGCMSFGEWKSWAVAESEATLAEINGNW